MSLTRDARFAFRSLRRDPAYSVPALLTLMLGIGATTTVFGVVRTVLLAPLSFPAPDRLVQVWEMNGRGSRMAGAWRNFVDYRARSRSFEAMAAYTSGESTVLGAGQPLRERVATVSGGFFETFRVAPARGRAFLAEEHEEGAPPAVIVSDAFWRTVLGADGSFSERELEVSGFRARVVGVMPSGFDHPDGADLWIPLELEAQSEGRSAHNWLMAGRLREGVEATAARADLDAITRAFVAEDPGVVEQTWFEDFFPRAVHIADLRESLVGETRRPLLILLAASLVVLLVACTNLASATLARGAARDRDYAVRRSLGADRPRLLRQLFTEHLVLALGGGVFGVLTAAFAVRLLPVIAPAGIPRLDELRLDAPVLSVAILASALTSVLFGLLPALRTTADGDASSLRSGVRAGHTRRAQRVWKSLIAFEVALALMLLVGAGLLLRSFDSILRVQPGFRTENVLTATISPPATRYAGPSARRTYYTALRTELDAVPGVAAAGLIATAPMTGVSNGLVGIREGAQAGVTGDYQLADEGYFDALGIPLLRGRLFDVRDHENAPHVVVVSAGFAALAWPGRDPIGREMTGGGMDEFWNQDRWATVIGVVGDIRQRDLTAAPRPTFYFPLSQRPFRSWSMTVVLRPAAGRAVDLAAGVRAAVRRVDEQVPVTISTIESRLSGALTPRRFTLIVLGFFALASLVLACIGIWGVVAWAVARRTREIGIRLALGADSPSVRRLIQRAYLTPVAIGCGAGLVLSLAVTRAVRGLLYDVQPTDPLVFVAVVTVLVAAAWLASFLPSRRTMRVSPLETMRAE
ncbi:MAG: ABC transporter permease [Gemmatimonadetes bacterium]|nr:ABC transporter permease [Gemmatimonadota bacterium]